MKTELHKGLFRGDVDSIYFVSIQSSAKNRPIWLRTWDCPPASGGMFE
jgi:hypothetical protein